MELNEKPSREAAVQTDPTTRVHKCGRPALSPNGLTKELKEQSRFKEREKGTTKGSRRRTEMHKRQNDKLSRQRRKRLQRQRLLKPLGETVRKRLKAVRYYRHWRERFSEQEAAQRAAQKHAVSVSTIRRWDRLYESDGLAALLPKPVGPVSGPYMIALDIQFLVVALRLFLGWNEKRIAQELRQRGIARVSHTAVGDIFKRYHLPTRTYHTKARCDGVAKLRYEKERPNQQWHIDFAETKLQDGTVVRIVALVDDYSRYCLECKVVPDMTTEAAIQTIQTAWQAFGLPDEIVSDNGRAFTSVHEGVPTAFGLLLQQKGIHHFLITPYWPESNGKAEAFVKIIKHECLNHPFATLEELQQALAEFVIFYNHFRLHSSLGYQTPVSRFLGIPTVKHHGLAGIPKLPTSLVVAFPPSQPVQIHQVNLRTVKQRFALAII
jgi:transposase InsO family protein